MTACPKAAIKSTQVFLYLTLSFTILVMIYRYHVLMCHTDVNKVKTALICASVFLAIMQGKSQIAFLVPYPKHRQ
jgi:hypothetical protein